MREPSLVGWEPGRPLEIIAGTPRDGGQDRAARALAPALEEVIDVPVSVSNVPGRGGGNAWDLLATYAGDAHRVSISSPTLITNTLNNVADLGHGDVTQLGLLCTEYIAFAVPTGSPISSPTELLDALAGPNPPVVSLATAWGNVNHIAVTYLCEHLGVDPRAVQVRVFDSARHAIADALETPGGIAAVSAASVLPELRDGSIRVIATSAPTRLGGQLSSIQTWTELGVDCVIGTWRGLVGPPELSAAAVSLWDATLSSAIATESWRSALIEHNWTDSFLMSAETESFMQTQEVQMQDALRSLSDGDQPLA